MRSLIIIMAVIGLSGCWGRTVVIYTPLPEIPLNPMPELTGNPEVDISTLGAEAIRYRRLIQRYNDIAEVINTQHGVPTPGLDAPDFTIPLRNQNDDTPD